MESELELERHLVHYQARLATIAGRIAILNAEWQAVMCLKDEIMTELTMLDKDIN